MKHFLILIAFIGINTIVFSQRIMVIEKANMRKNYKYFEGDIIHLGLHKDTIISGVLSDFHDSVVIIDNHIEISLEDIKFIPRGRNGFAWFAELFYKAGIPYFIITTANRAINKDQPVITQTNLIISSSITAAAIISHLLSRRNLDIENKKWKIKLLEM